MNNLFFLLCLCLAISAKGAIINNDLVRVRGFSSTGNVTNSTENLQLLTMPLTRIISDIGVDEVVFQLASFETIQTTSYFPKIIDELTTSGFGGNLSAARDSSACSFTGFAPTVSGPLATKAGTLDCVNTTTFSLLTVNVVPSQVAASAICRVLNVNPCSSFVTVSSLGTELSAVVASSDPIAVAVAIREAVSNPSPLTMLRVHTLKIQGVSVYIQQALMTKHEPGSVVSCASRLWYLTFLILGLPVCYIVARYAFRYGVRVGREKVETLHKEEQQKLANIQSALANQRGLPPQWQQWQNLQEMQYQNYYNQQYNYNTQQ